MARKVMVEVEAAEENIEKILESLRKAGVKVTVRRQPEEVRERILKRWRRPGRRARPGDLAGMSLEEEFE